MPRSLTLNISGKNPKSKRGLNKLEKRQVKKIVNSAEETKFIDIASDDSSVINTNENSTGMSSFSQVAQGDGESQRIGNSIRFKGISYNHLLTSTLPCFVRHLIFMVLTPSLNSDLDTALNGTNMEVNTYLPREVSKYRVLRDRVHKVIPQFSSTGKGKLQLKGYINLKMKRMVYDGDLAGDGQSYSIREFFYTDNSTASSLTRNGNIRVFYKD